MPIIPAQRFLFDVPASVAYFNCAANSPQLNESSTRLLAGALKKSHPWERTPPDFFEDAETIRHLASELFGGQEDGYAIVPAASYGISSAARAIEPHLAKGDKVLVIEGEFPSNVLPWQRVIRETGAVLITVPTPVSGNWTQAILDHLDGTIKVLSVSNCHWTNGAFINLEIIGKACRDKNCILVVDATQTLGALPLSVDTVKPDFLVAAGYKWLLCPYGFGLMYVGPEWRNARPLEETWLARDNAVDFNSLIDYSDEYMSGARRFDVGEKCTPTSLPGAIAALEQLKKWGVNEIAASLSVINKRIALHLESLGFELPDESVRCPHMFGALLPKHYKGNLVNDLKEKKIYISQRGSALRFSPHLHINEYDIERLLETLTELVQREQVVF